MNTTTTLEKEAQFGDLILAFTTDYSYRWNDKGSGASRDGAFYHPNPPAGFYALGSIGVSDYESPNGRFASLCVKAASTSTGKPALAAPASWTCIWTDKGSGADDDGSCWRPNPPEGYVALGDVFVSGYDQPTGDQVMCVATELVYEGVIGALIWDDAGSGASRDFGAWQIEASRPFLDTPDGIFAVNSFVGQASHTKPGSAPEAWNLRLPLPTLEAGAPAVPSLDSRTRPPATTNAVIDRVVTVPFTAVADDDHTLAWRVENSPFYTVERSVEYTLVLFIDNRSSLDQSSSTAIQTGISTEQSETFSVTTGLTVSYESGVQAGLFSTKLSVSLSIELGYSSTTSVTQFRSETDEAVLIVAPNHAAAMWTESDSLRVRRADGSAVGSALSFDTTDTAYIVSEFPHTHDAAFTGPRSRSARRRSRLSPRAR